MHLIYVNSLYNTQTKNVHTCIGPGMQDRTRSMFSEVTSTSFTATRTSPEKRITIKDSRGTIPKPKRPRIRILKTIYSDLFKSTVENMVQTVKGLSKVKKLTSGRANLPFHSFLNYNIDQYCTTTEYNP